MNKIYKVVWSKVKHCYVVTSELAKRNTKGCGARSLRMAAVSVGVAAALIGGVGFGSPVAEAADPVISGSVTKGGTTKNFTQANFTYESGGTTYQNDYGYANTFFDGESATPPTEAKGYAVNITSAPNWRFFVGAGIPYGTISDNSVTVNGDSTNITQEVIGGYAYGEETGTKTSTVTKNSVTVNGGTLASVSGANMGGYWAAPGTASDNTVTINAGLIKGDIRGAFGYDKAEENKVYIKGGTVDFYNDSFSVTGGESGTGTASNNEVIISDGTAGNENGGGIRGGMSWRGQANENKVTISGGTVKGAVYGGMNSTLTGRTIYSGDTPEEHTPLTGTVSQNGVIISAGTVTGKIYGGLGAVSASGNTVTIKENAVLGKDVEVYGGTAMAKYSTTTYTYTGSVWEVNTSVDKVEYGDVTNNTVNIGNFINSSANDDIYVYGGMVGGNDDATSTKKVNVSNNTVTVDANNSTISYVYGGVIRGKANGDVKENKVEIKSGTVYGVYGGLTTVGDATGNSVSVIDGDVKFYYGQILGGSSENGDAIDNTVTISGGTLVNTAGVKIIGGSVLDADHSATSNQVIISNGTIGSNEGSQYENGFYVIAGDASERGGNATDNTITISGGSFASQNTFEFYGGKARNIYTSHSETGEVITATAAADDNTVEISGGTFSDNENVKIYGAYSSAYSSAIFGTDSKVTLTATVDENKVKISGGTFSGNVDVYGGYGTASAGVYGSGEEAVTTLTTNGNTVEISGGTFSGNVNVYGGYGHADGTSGSDGGTATSSSSADNNEVIISGGKVQGAITGGYTDTGKADSNKVTITAGTIGNSSTNSTSVEVIGGKGVTSASSNTVSIDGNVKVVGYTNVYGGKASGNAEEKTKGEAKSNTVTINYSASNPNNKLDSIYGGYAGDDSNAPGVVTGNTVTINGGDIYWAYGGAAKYGDVEGNTANFNGGTNKNSVYGGATQYGNANNNTVTVDGGTIEGAYGGTVGNQREDSYGDATNNTVTINDGTVKQQTIGGNSRNGVAKNNTLTIAGGLIATNGFLVAGGQSTTGSAENNAVFINKGTIQGSVYGGRSTEKGSATGNQVIIKGGEITGRTLSSGYRVSNVYGGYSSGGDVTGNNVSIQGNATIDSRSSIYGGWSINYVWVNNSEGVLVRTEQGRGTVSYNSVNISKAITVNGLYGGVGDATKSTGNNLYLATTGVKAEEVGSFQTIALTSALPWSNGATVLTATKFDDGTAVKASLDVSAANFTSAANGEKMTLLASGTDNNIKALSLKYNGGTADLSESKLNQVVKEGTITPDSGTNGVTINTSKNAHIVSLDAANSFKNVTYRVADYVQGVSFGEMTWGTGRDASGTDFADVTDANIDISGLSFKDPGKIAANGTMKLVENATNLAAGTDREHSQTFNENATNGVTIAGTLNGTVTRTTAGEIGYKAAGNTLSVNLAGWDKTKDEDSTTLSGWAKPISTTVETDGMNVSGMNPGDKKTILTADTADFFKDAVVNGTNKWKDSGDFSETTKGVTVTGTTTGGGVKVDETTNKSIIYQQSKNDVTTLKLEGITFDSTDVAATFGNAYDFTPATITASDTSDVLFTNASSLTSNQSMTLVDTTGALGTATIAAFTDKSYVKPINEDVTGNLHLNGGRTDWLKQDGGTKLVYTVGDNLVTDATLSGDLAWDVSAPHYNNTDYKFDGNTTVNVGVNFTATVDPLNATTKSMTLIKNAADDSKVTGTPAFTVSLDQANTTLSANATGAAGLSGNDVTYTVSGVELNKVTVKSVGDTYDTVPDGWTMASNLTIDTDSMTEPIFAAGSPKAILKGNGYFNSVTITGANAFGTKDFEPVSGNGVTLSGTQDKGVDKSSDNASIVYKVGTKDVKTVDIGTVEWGGEALDGSSADYNYAGAAFGTDNFVISNPDQVEVDTSMTLLKANETLAAMAEETKKASFVYSPVSGVRIDGDITGTMSRSGNNIMFAATENKASQLTFTNVEWKDTLMTRPANIVFDGAKVVTTDIKFTNIDSQVADQTMTLVKNFDGTPSAIEGDHYMVGSGRMGEGAAEMSGNDLIFRAKTGTAPTEATHETVMAMEAGTAVVAAGREYVDSAVEGLGLVSNMAPDGTSTFASMGGGVGRYKTGSHVDTHTWSAVVAVGSKREHKKGNLEWGVFAEYGRGNYTLHDDNGGRGDGDTNYAGGGLLAKWTNKHDVYTEASVRMGRMSDSASNMLMDRLGNSYGYDIHANYFGAHVGLGKIIKVKKNRDLDVYGKYFYLRRNGVDFDAGGNHYTLDSVTSSLLRIGARYGSNDKKWNWYGGLAYEYEFGGESKGTVDGLAIRSASIKGGSVRGEIGMRMEATKTNPWKVDIGIYGYGGKHRGFGGNVSVAYMF